MGPPRAHVATEFQVSRPTVSTWVARYLQDGEEGLVDRPSTPVTSPSRTRLEVVERIEALRLNRKWSCAGSGTT